MEHRAMIAPRPTARPPVRTRLLVDTLEDRHVPSGLTLTPLVQVSDPSPLDNSIPPNGTVFLNSEVEPQIAVDPKNPAHAVAIWQQDRYRSVGGARALVVSVTTNADNSTTGAHWSTPAAIPYFDSTNATFNTIDPTTGQGYAR